MATHGDLMQEVQVRLQRGVVTASLDSDTISILLNTAYQFVYPYNLQHFPWFYVKSAAITASTSFTLPDDFRRIACVDVPLATFRYARIANHREYNYLQNIPDLASKTANPLCRVDATVLTIGTSLTGTLFYYMNIPDVASSATTTNITTMGTGNAFIHPVFEETIVLQAMILAYARHMQIAKLNQQQQDDHLKMIAMQKDKMDESLKPYATWQREIPEA